MLQALLNEGDEPSRPSIGRRNPAIDPVASSAQKGLWFLDQREPGNAAYNVPLVFRVEGTLNESILGRALDELVRRHEPLRTIFRLQEGELRQIVLAPSPLALEKADFTRAGEAALTAWIRERAAAPFDLGRGPLIRGGHAKVSPGEEVLLIVMHHAVVDAWSGEMLFGELLDLYRRLEQGVTLPAEPSLQYGDYCEWQAGQTYEASLEFWKKKLAGATPLQLPADRPRPAQRSQKGEKVRFEIPKATVDRLRERCRESGATLYVGLATAFQILLHRLSNQNDVLIGSGGASRGLPELADMVGLFLNNLILRTDFTGDPSFAASLERVRDGFVDSLSHQEVPFEQVLAAVGAKRSSDPNPLFNVVFTFNERAAETLSVSTARITLDDPNLVEVGCSKHDLSVHCWNTNGAVEGIFELSTDRFERETVEEMTKLFASVVEQGLADDKLPVSRYRLLSEEASRKVLVEWNRTAIPFSRKTVVDQFREVARLLPELPAVTCCHATLTYGQLDAESDRLASVLTRSGLKAETPVAVCTSREVGWVTAFLGVLKAGGVYLPLDPNQPAQRLRAMVAEANPHLILCDGKTEILARDLGALAHLVSDLDGVTAGPLPPPRPEQLAYVLFTSGSTGTPKGVMVEHRALGHLAEWAREQYALGPGERAGCLTNVGFDPTLEELGAYLSSGVSIYIAPDHLRLSPEEMFQWMDSRKLTVCQLPAPILETVLDKAWTKESSLRLFLTGGERLRKRPGPEAPFRIVNRYGPTECTVYCTQEWLGEPGPVATIGRPIANTQVYVLDSHLQPVARGTAGEICVGGVGLARGYWGDAAKTAKAFVANPFRAGERLYRTGDLGRFRLDGTLEFLGRADGQVKVRGMRIEIGEIEAVLKEAPGIRDAIVVPSKNEAGETSLVGYGIGQSTEEAMRDFLRARLPENMVPARFLTLERFPLTSNGKVDVKRLPAPSAPAQNAPALRQALTGVSAAIGKVWCEVLGIATVGRDQNFFDLGGHSLMLAQVQVKLSAALGKTVALTDLIKYPTIAALAAALGEEGGAPARDSKAVLNEAKARAEMRAKRLGRGRVN